VNASTMLFNQKQHLLCERQWRSNLEKSGSFWKRDIAKNKPK
jgi:hypothetical protein